MKIRGKIVVVVLPLVITPLLFAGLISSLLARNGISSLAAQFLQFKGEQIASFASGQWQLLEDNGLTGSAEFVDAAVLATEDFAQNVLRSGGELIFALDPAGAIAFAVGAVPEAGFSPEDMAELAGQGQSGWQRLAIAGEQRVAHATAFEPLSWQIYVTELTSAFYQAPNTIVRQLSLVLAISLLVSVVLLVAFAAYLTNPLRQIVDAMTRIIRTNDLSSRVDVVYNDETGILGQRFNMMIGRLDNAYASLKREAFRAVIAQKREQKTRSIFQRYVPADVIDEIFRNPEDMLTGKNRDLAVMFSDIRAFTTISENLPPEELVESLNRYFTLMVDSITARGGIVDKYIGDAIMAFFGAPVEHDDDAYQAVLACLDMKDSLTRFNTWQTEHGRPTFRMGMGINYGNVTVGNIGSDKKMDYTIIGDMVNLANRLEGLTKLYRVPLVVSQSVRTNVGDKLPARMLDRVVVKGRTDAVGVYTVGRDLAEREAKAWALHNSGMSMFYKRQFDKAGDRFAEVLALLPADLLARRMVERCMKYAANPPPDRWTGAVAMTAK